MSRVTTDYRQAVAGDTLQGVPLSQYRLVHWMVDILKNFLADPVNVYDQRLRNVLRMQDGLTAEELNALFRVELPYGSDVKKAGTTPAIMVSAGAVTYPADMLNRVGTGIIASSGAVGAHRGGRIKQMSMSIAILTESLDGTVLLKDILENFLLVNERLLMEDSGMLSEFHMAGASEPQAISAGQAGNAKTLYQQVLTVQAVGAITWDNDTQGPVFRGVEVSSDI